MYECVCESWGLYSATNSCYHISFCLLLTDSDSGSAVSPCRVVSCSVLLCSVLFCYVML